MIISAGSIIINNSPIPRAFHTQISAVEEKNENGGRKSLGFISQPWRKIGEVFLHGRVIDIYAF